MIFFNENEIKNKIQHYKIMFTELLKTRKRYLNNKKVDEASQESMIASDSSAQRSKSLEDRLLHH